VKQSNPLNHPDEWEDDLLRRYPDPNSDQGFVATDPDKKKEGFRDYDAEARASVKEFYRLNHHHQTFDFVQQKRAEYLQLNKRRMGIWEAMEFLNNLVDDSDPDTDATQIEHLLQTAESVRADGHPRWLILTGLIHDLGKILCLFDEPQGAVVGDTFPVGCAFSPKIVFHEYFQDNPDWSNPEYKTKFGIYNENIGLENVTMSWGHDEYLYHVVKDYLPEEALYPIRYHSFYPAHKENDYEYLFNDHDREMFKWVREFNQYDLYSKSDERPSVEKLRPYYEELINEYFPAELAW
jgi:inositol oxygenase